MPKYGKQFKKDIVHTYVPSQRNSFYDTIMQINVPNETEMRQNLFGFHAKFFNNATLYRACKLIRYYIYRAVQINLLYAVS